MLASLVFGGFIQILGFTKRLLSKICALVLELEYRLDLLLPAIERAGDIPLPKDERVTCFVRRGCVFQEMLLLLGHCSLTACSAIGSSV